MIITINDDLTSTITTDDELYECVLPSYNPETLFPFSSAEEVESFAATLDGNINYFSPKLSDEEKAILHAKNIEFIQTEYQRQRAAEYPDFKDYLDGIVKGDKVQMKAYIDACLAVKAKYPKPE